MATSRKQKHLESTIESLNGLVNEILQENYYLKKELIELRSKINSGGKKGANDNS